MPVKFNTDTISSIKFGSDSISRAYLGTVPVWSGVGAPMLIYWDRDLGYYDVKPYYENYQNLTRANFFISSVNIPNIDKEVVLNISKRVKVMCESHLSYDPENGYVDCYFANYVDGDTFINYANPPVVFVPSLADVEELNLVDIGNNTYNIASVFPDEYLNFTDDNFLLKPPNLSNPMVDVGGLNGTYQIVSNMGVVKMYIMSTGRLRCYVEFSGKVDNVMTTTVENSWNERTSYPMFLIRKIPV